MKTITIEEINDLYKKCDIEKSSEIIRTTINTGTLNNELNNGTGLYGKKAGYSTWTWTAVQNQ